MISSLQPNPDIMFSLSAREKPETVVPDRHSAAMPRLMTQSSDSPVRPVSFFRDAIRGISYYALPSLLRVPIGLILVPVYTRILTPTDYGVLEILDITAALTGTLMATNIGVSLFYYYARAQNEWEKRQALWTGCAGAFLLGLLTLSILIPSAGFFSRIGFGAGSAYTRAVQLLFANLALSFPLEMIMNCLRATNRPRQFAAVAVARQLASACLNVTFIAGMHTGFIGMLWSSLLVTTASGVFVIWRFWPLIRGSFSPLLFWRYIVYSVPLDISALATLTLTMGDRYILRHYVSLADIGIYSLAYKFGFLVSSTSLIFNIYWRPKMFSVVRQPDGEYYYSRTQTYYTAAMVGLMVVLSTVLLPIVQIATGKDFHEATAYIPLFALAYTIRAAGEFNRNPLYLAKKTSIEAGLNWLGCILALSGYLLFIPRFGLRGGILSSAAAFMVLYFVGTWVAQRCRPMPLERRRLITVWVSGLACVAVYRFTAPSTLVTQLVLGTVCTIAFPLFLWALGFLSVGEKAMLYRMGTGFRLALRRRALTPRN